MRVMLILLLSPLMGCPPSNSKGGTMVDTCAPEAGVCDSDTSDTGCSLTSWYSDADGDGFGDPATAVEACDGPEGMVRVGGDCDDGNDQIYPGADELCLDGVVNDCDATDDAAAVAFCSGAGPFSLEEADAALRGPSYGDESGRRLHGRLDFDGDGLDDLLVTAGDGHSPRVVEVPSPVAGLVDLGHVGVSIYGDTPSGVFAQSLSGSGDVDGDGFADVIIGDDADAQAYLVLSPVGEDMNASEADTVFTREEEGGGLGSGLGRSVAGSGDTDGDGLPDLLLGAPTAQGLPVDSDRGDCASESTWDDEYGPGFYAGVAYLFTTERMGTVDANDADARLLGEDGEDYAGSLVAGPGDMNGDGLTDMALVAPGNCEGGAGAGAIYVVQGPVSGDLVLGDADGKIVGSPSAFAFDTLLSDAGDVDGDGTPDLLSADTYYDHGTVYVFLGPVSGTISLSTAINARIRGTVAVELNSIAAAGDLDLDGYGDVLVGGNWTENWSALAAVVYGPLSGVISLDEADQIFVGAHGSAFEVAVAGAGDTDADGLPDLLVGAPYASSGVLADTGITWLLLGGGALQSGNGEI